MPELFGFKFGKSKQTEEPTKAKSFVSPDYDDGATVVTAGGFYGSYLDLEGDIKSEVGFINHYRTMILQPEVEQAVEDVCNDAIVFDEYRTPVKLVMDHYEQSDNVKKKIYEEFDTVLSLLDFNNKAYDIFKKWYIDGRLYYHIITDNQNGNKGITEVRPIDPTKIRKIREVVKEKNKDGIEVIKDVKEFYMYDQTMHKTGSAYTYGSYDQKGVKVSPDAICYVNSGLLDGSRKRVIGHLHKAIKPLNQLRMIEDAVVIYRISRAPERRIFYVDVGNLPKNKAEQYLKDIMNRYRNKLVYDASTGEIKDDKRHMSMLEDYWMPRREGGRGTEISTLDGGQNLGEMEDVEYFQKLLYRALHVPTSRLEADNGFNMGRSAEITRDELKFFKFIERLRKRFSDLFIELLKTQLLMKNIITADDWKEISQNVYLEYAKDSYFTELKESEILKERMEVLREVNEYIGRYYSIEWIRRNILKQTEDEIADMDKQMSDEKAKGLHGEEDEEF
tara:strand:+ start:651 stop:2165 length:1515 start_codon:yes stop_codon:yes gene_type:complete